MVVKSCEWKGCGDVREAVLLPSSDSQYNRTLGWYEAQHLHQPYVDVLVNMDNGMHDVVYKDHLNNRTIYGTAQRVPASGAFCCQSKSLWIKFSFYLKTCFIHC